MITVVIRKVNREWLDTNFHSLVESLSVACKARILRIKDRNRALAQLASSLMLNEIIEQNSAFADGYTLKTGNHGKPYVEELPTFHFNLSHSGDYVVVAYGNEEIGVDIQQIKDYRPKVAKRCCTKEELTYIEERDSSTRFTEVWTLKESYAKFTGEGMAEDFRTIDIDLENRVVRNTTAKYITKQHENYMISLCAENTNNTKFVY